MASVPRALSSAALAFVLAGVVPSSAPAASKIELVWVVHPAVQRGAVGMRHVDLVVRAGPNVRTIGIDARYSVFFAMDMQPRCETPRRRPRKRVAELYMNGGGNLLYTVERTSPETLEVMENVSTDGLCVDAAGRETACPVARARLATLDVPRGATIVETFHEVVRDENGAVRERAIDCAKLDR